MRLPRFCRNAATEYEARPGSGEQPTTAHVVNCSRICCASSATRRARLRRRAGQLLQLVVLTLGELLDDLRAERGQVVRLTRADEAAIHVYLLVDPVGPGVDQVSAERRPRRQGRALSHAGVDQRPRAVADRSDGLA